MNQRKVIHPNLKVEISKLPIIAGVDEVGRGAFAGPLVAGCVVFDHQKIQPGWVRINDSKKLSKKQREISDHWVRQNSLAWGIGKASSKYIDKYGITRATFFAYRQAILIVERKLGRKVDILMLDAFYLPRMRGLAKNQQFPLIKGDSKSKSVAAASIIAKVYRDNLMIKLATKPSYKHYFWESNVGYGTKYHRDAIKKYGTTHHHRLRFLNAELRDNI